jgi:NSS family neurotransmitter:Na+ symporter
VSQRRQSLWGTRFGFYLAAVGSAFGLGNLWRFPYVTVENGGGAFVLLYVLFALSIGLPLLIGELMLGKLTRRSVIRASQRLSGNWVWFGRLSFLCCLLGLSYYAVISGWVLHFIMQFFVANLTTGSFQVDKTLKVLRDSGSLQVALTSVHLLITLIIVVKGVQQGIEKWVGNAMPVFVLLLIILVTKSLSLPTSSDAIRFLFYPEFSQLKLSSALHALGHVLFSLSIGFGTMVTFGSYLNEDTRIPEAGFRVTMIDTMISLFAGLLIFPLLIGANFKTTGPELLFQTLPRLLLDLDSGFFFGMAFFICLYLAALGASIGLLESLVANLLDVTKLSRTSATWLMGGVAFIGAILPALSTSVLRGVNVDGHSLMEILDGVLVNGLLPLAALGLAYGAGRHLTDQATQAEFINDASIATHKLYSHWIFSVRYIVPIAIAGAYALALIGFLLKFRN